MTLRRLFASFVLLLCLAVQPALAELKLPSVIGANMVLQRDQAVPVWGWDTAGTEVSVSLGETKVSAKAGDDGRWQVELPAMKAGGPHTLKISGSSEKELGNILFGEVWLCSGQSNMEWPVRASDNSQDEIAAANHPRIRHIKIPHVPAAEPQSNVASGGWQVCSPQTVSGFTAVGYYFGRYLQDKLDVPIGLIGSNWGGTRIEPWTPPVGFQQVPALKEGFADKLGEFPTRRGDNVVHQSPLALYNGMIHPLVPYGIRGAIWYQGESNNGEGMLYHEKMKALISGWRSVWKNPEMPFYFVQLAPYRYGGDPTRLAGIWQAQLATLSVPHTGMAVTTDIGNTRDIHPRNKQDVGKRLALWALAKNYGQKDIVYSGPLFKSIGVEGDKIRVSFDHVGSGLVASDGKPLSHFTIAGKATKDEFVEAKAEIDGDTIVVSADGVKDPVAVRFGWHQEAEPNLANKDGLPASPFEATK